VSSLDEERAARGGLDGGEGIPEGVPRTSGKPLGPAGPGSGVVETSQTGRRVDDIAAGEDIGLTDDSLAVSITRTTGILVSGGRHFARFLPGLRRETFRDLSKKSI